MLVVSGTMSFPEGTADAVRAAMRKVVAETLKEQGCITYRFYPDMDNPDHYRVFEEWESGDALKAHGASAHIAEYRATLGEIGILSREITVYQVEKSSKL
jgi:quinol monooxygenase YgiN